jgi:hypothetical protein
MLRYFDIKLAYRRTLNNCEHVFNRSMDTNYDQASAKVYPQYNIITCLCNRKSRLLVEVIETTIILLGVLYGYQKLHAC